MLAIGVNYKWDACPRKGNTEAPVHPHTKLSTNANHMSVMKTSLTIIPMCPRERFPSYKNFSRLVLCYKKDWATLLHFIYSCYLLPITNYLITKLSVTLLKTACHFLLLLVGFDTLTYQKDYHRSPILVGHQDYSLALLPGSEAPLVRKNLYSVLKFTVTCYFGK